MLAWVLPVAAVALLTGADSVYAQQGLFFSGTAVVTFGGAYAVLAFVAQRAVEHYGWLAAGDTQLPGLATIRPVPVVIALIAAILIFRLRWPVLRVLGACAALGLIAGLAGLPGI